MKKPVTRSIHQFELVQHIYSFLDGYYDKRRHCWVARVSMFDICIQRPIIVSVRYLCKENARLVLQYEKPGHFAELRKYVSDTSIQYVWSYYMRSPDDRGAYVYVGNQGHTIY
jgi:hypothetical protein